MKYALALLLTFNLLAEDLPTIQWDASTVRLLQAGATYGRMRELDGGSLLCSFEKAGRSWTLRSEDAGKSWNPPVQAGLMEAAAAANPELCVLKSGRVLCFFNERPKQQRAGLAFTIRMSVSEDGGRSWMQRPEAIYTAGEDQSTACWEPAALQLPDGKIQLFFAHELPGQQEILRMISDDEGSTWSEAAQVSLRPGRRDGMPVPLLTKAGELLFSIEDNGIAGQDRPHPPFRPTIVFPREHDRWMALALDPGPKINVAAPYLAQLPGGQTLLSVQSNEDEPRWHRMVVYVGDAQAKGFTHRSLPFGLPPESNGEWNSLTVLTSGKEVKIVALSHTTIAGRRGLWCVEGHVVTVSGQ